MKVPEGRPQWAEPVGPWERLAGLHCEILLLGGSNVARNLTASPDGLDMVLPVVRRVRFPGVGHTAADNAASRPSWRQSCGRSLPSLRDRECREARTSAAGVVASWHLVHQACCPIHPLRTAGQPSHLTLRCADEASATGRAEYRVDPKSFP